MSDTNTHAPGGAARLGDDYSAGIPGGGPVAGDGSDWDGEDGVGENYSAGMFFPSADTDFDAGQSAHAGESVATGPGFAELRREIDLLAEEAQRLDDQIVELTTRFERLDARFPTGGRPEFEQWMLQIARTYYLSVGEVREAADRDYALFNTAAHQEYRAFWAWWQEAWSGRGSGAGREAWHAAFAQFLVNREPLWMQRSHNAKDDDPLPADGWDFATDTNREDR